jgi:AcrR family transcriptional regulator
LSRDRIVGAAIDFVDHNGLSSLTMRRLGKALGVEAMSLYRYVNGREDLLEGVIGYMVAQLHLRPEGGQLEPTDGWQVYLQWLAHGVRALARDHPNVFPLIATRHPAAPWLRPPRTHRAHRLRQLATRPARRLPTDATGLHPRTGRHRRHLHAPTDPTDQLSTVRPKSTPSTVDRDMHPGRHAWPTCRDPRE